MARESNPQRTAESLVDDLVAPSWQFWRDKVGTPPRIFGLGHEARPVMTRLGRLLVQDARSKVRCGAAYALGGLLLPYSVGDKPADSWPEADAHTHKIRKQIEDAYSAPTPTDDMREAVSCLTKALGDADPLVRKYALIALGTAGPFAKDALSVVSTSLQDHDEEMRLWAGFCTANMTRQDGGTLRLIADKMVDEPAVSVLRMAGSMAMLFLYGVDRRPALPVILKAIRPDHPGVAQNAIATVLMVLGSEPVGSPDVASAVPVLVPALGSQPLADRAKGALLCLGPAAVSHLVDAIHKHPESPIRLAIADVLGKMGPAARDASAALLELKKQVDDNGVVSVALKRILGS